ncbi:hypothetical protein Tco_0915372, partial [Tanacetum coccineum]
MADNRTMAQMLQAPIEGYEDAIVVPPINANNFELKQPLINLVQSNKFTGRQDPHNHLRFFNKVTSTFRHPEVPNTSIKLLLFPFSLDGEARDWTPSSMSSPWLLGTTPTRYFLQFFEFKRSRCLRFPSAAGGNFLDKMPQEGLAIIESKSKVRYSRSRATASLEDKMTIKMKQMRMKMKALVVTTPAPVKAVEEVCVTCGSNHNFNHCPLTRGGNDFPVFHDNIQQFQQTAAVGNFIQRNQPSNLASQMKPPGFNQPNVQNNQNRYQGNIFNSNQNRRGNFNQNPQNNQNQVYQAPPYQPPTNQPLVNQALPPISQVQGVSKTDFESYAKANDANMNNLQMKLDNFQRNPRNEAKAITIRSGASYDGPPIPSP